MLGWSLSNSDFLWTVVAQEPGLPLEVLICVMHVSAGLSLESARFLQKRLLLSPAWGEGPCLATRFSRSRMEKWGWEFPFNI